MIVHFPVMYIKQPLKNMVIIGGGDLMTLREVMKYYSIEKVFMLELKPKIINLCENISINQNTTTTSVWKLFMAMQTKLLIIF